MINYLRATWGLALGHFSIEIYAALLVPLYPIITNNLNISLAQISFVIAFGHLVASVLQPYFGFIADKLNHRIFMVWGLIVTAIFIPLSIKCTTIHQFTICLLLGMFGNAFFHPQSSSLMKDFNKNNANISRMMGIFLGLGTTGYALGPYVATICAKKFGFDNLIYIFLLGLICAIFMYFFVPKMPQREIYNRGSFLSAVAEILKNKTCMLLVLISTVKSSVSICFGTYIPFLLEKNNFSIDKIGLIITLFFFAGSFATLISSKIEKYLGIRGVIALSMLGILPCTILFLILLPYFKTLAVINFILAGFFVLLSVGIILVQAQRAMPKYTGVISGTIQGVSWGLGALFLAPMGIVGQIFGVDKILIIISIIAFITGLCCLKAKTLKMFEIEH